MTTEISKLQVGDVGTIFRVRVLVGTVVIDLSSCITKKIIFKKPDNTVVEQDAEFYTDGTDGYMQYTTIDGDLDQTGLWKYQGLVEFSNASWHTGFVRFLVKDNLEEG